MTSLPIIISDLICVSIVFYVWARMYLEPVLERRAVLQLRNIGMTLIFTVVLDHIWEYFYERSDFSSASLQLLHSIASVEFLCVPVSFFFLLMYHQESWDFLDSIELGADLSLFTVLLVNIWFPVYFSLDEYAGVRMGPIAAVYDIGAIILFGSIMIHDFVTHEHLDFENGILIFFTLLIASLGTIGVFFYGDVLSLWECYAIVYLFFFLALRRLYDKTDQVTGIPNRNAFTEVFFRGRRKSRILVSFDLNHLKVFNDSNGHPIGDQYLRAFAQTAQRKLATYGKLYRVGGDEFCLVSFSKPDGLKGVLENLHDQEKCDPEFGDFPLDFAYGMAVRKAGEADEELYDRADEEMYAYKHRTESPVLGPYINKSS